MDFKTTPTLDETVQLAHQLRGAELRGLTEEEVQQKFVSLDPGVFGIREPGAVWFRGRICESPDGYESLVKMIYPPATTDFGRANIRGRRVFYASWNILTVLSEICAQVGDVVQVVAARVIPGKYFQCSVIGEYAHWLHSGRTRIPYPPMETRFSEIQQNVDFDTRQKMHFVDSFLSEEYRKLPRRSYEYKLTAVLAESIYKRPAGMLYPSVETYGSMNLAVPSELFDECFEILFTRLYRVERVYGYGVYGLAELMFSREFDTDGRIKWSPMADTDPTHLLPRNYDERYVGWRIQNAPKGAV